jgi:nitrite reductase/ring-hydroxylating ferredoxin subunit
MHYLCKTSDVGDAEAKGFEIEGQSVLLVNHDAQLRVYMNWCPHLGIELNFMPDQFLDADNAMIMCANHGALFEIESGHCLSGPCSGDALVGVPHEVRGDEVWAGPLPEQA